MASQCFGFLPEVAKPVIYHLVKENSQIEIVHCIFTFSIFFLMSLLSKGKNSIFFLHPLFSQVSLFFLSSWQLFFPLSALLLQHLS